MLPTIEHEKALKVGHPSKSLSGARLLSFLIAILVIRCGGEMNEHTKGDAGSSDASRSSKIDSGAAPMNGTGASDGTPNTGGTVDNYDSGMSPSDGGMDAGPDIDAAVSLPEGTCQEQVVTLSEVCGSQTACPIADARDIVCVGGGHHLEFAPLAERIVFKLAYGFTMPYQQNVYELPIANGAAASLFQRTANVALLRRDESSAPMLVTLSGDVVELEAVDSPGNTTNFSVMGTAFDAQYDDAGVLHAFSLQGANWANATIYHAPGNELVASGDIANTHTNQLPDGSVTFSATLRDNSGTHLVAWSTATGLVAGPLLPLRVQDTNPFLTNQAVRVLDTAAVTAGTVVADVADDGITLYTLPTGSSQLESYTALPSDCTGMQLAPYPEICPTNSTSLEAGIRARDVAIERASDDSLWIFTLEGDTTYTCDWTDLNGCIETMTCDCRQVPTLNINQQSVRIRHQDPPSIDFRAPFELPSNTFATIAAKSTNSHVVIAILWSDYLGAQRASHLRFIWVEAP